MRYQPKKIIFQVNYKPKLSFFDKLYKNENIEKKFAHWKTDKLTVTFRDYDHQDSLLISYDRTAYECDSYKKERVEEIVPALLSEVTNFVEDGIFSRIGLRHYYLIEQHMSFSKLAEIINTKLFTERFNDIFDNEINDSAIVIDSKYNNYEVNLNLGPISKKEIPAHLRFNIDNHIDAEPQKRVKILNDVFNKYPEVALFLNIDYYMKKEEISCETLKKFWQEASVDIPKLVDLINSQLFEDKIK